MARRRRRNPATEVRELVLFTTNDSDLYRQRVKPILANLAKKIRKGTYDPAKALKLWAYLSDAGAQKYTKEFGDTGGSYRGPRGSTSYGIFTKSDRRDAAKEFAEYYAEELADEAGSKSNPRRRRTTRSSYRRIPMARKKVRRTTKTRRAKGYKAGVRIVRFKVRGRVKIVRFHKPGTKAGKRGTAAKRAAGKRLAKKYGFFRKGRAIYQKRPGRPSKLIRRL